MSSDEWALDGGGQAVLVDTDGHFVTLHSSRAFPPGATLVGRVPGVEVLRVKVRGSAKTKAGDMSFCVKGRFINLTRAQRAYLTSRAAP